MREILVIRFGALGDLCLLGWSLARLAALAASADPSPDQTHPRHRVTLVTKQAFAPLMQQCHGVDRVVPLERGDLTGLWRLATDLRRTRWDTVLDAHNILRGHGLLTLLGRRPDARLRKDTVQRLSLLRGGAPSSPRLQRTMRQRFDEVFTAEYARYTGVATPAGAFPGKGDPPATGNSVACPAPWAHLAPAAVHPACLGLAPGAQWDTKRWPEENFAALLRHFLDTTPHPVRIFLGPREEGWFTGSALEQAASAAGDRVRVIRRQPLVTVAAELAACRAVITNDSGLLHLAEGVGTPVLALFGPTVRQFGYFPGLDGSQVLEHDLDCRPCSRNGKAPCHRGDLACLREIAPHRAHAFLERNFTS